VVKKEDRTATFENLTYIDTSIIGGSIFILIIILVYRFNKEGKQQINGINGAIKQMGDDIKTANKRTADEKDKAASIKKAVQDMNNNLKGIERNRAIIEGS
jgi:uncharacterized protein YoxC